MEERDRKIEEIRKRILLKKRRKIRFFTYLFLMVLIICGFFFIKMKILKFLWNFEIFKIKEIKVYPESMTYILNLLELEKDKNLLFLDVNNLMEKINSIPEIEKCNVIKKFPSTLEIKITLRKGWAILKYKEKEFVIDKNGIIYNNEGNSIPDLIILGVKVNEKENKVEEIEKIRILRELEKWYNYYNVGNFLKLKIIDISDINKIVISDGIKSIFFTQENIKTKSEKLLSILKNLKDDYEYIDTRFKNFYIKFKNERTDNNRS
ncbi:MAG: cell division protein FtsQ/DivIB [Candidatus Ratteibacteria bacterium]